MSPEPSVLECKNKWKTNDVTGLWYPCPWQEYRWPRGVPPLEQIPEDDRHSRAAGQHPAGDGAVRPRGGRRGLLDFPSCPRALHVRHSHLLLQPSLPPRLFVL